MRLPRVVPKICFTIVLGVTIVQMARAGGTNDARSTGLRLYESGQVPGRDPLLRPGSGTSQSRSRDLDQTRLVLSPGEPAPGCTRRLRPGESVQRLGVAVLRRRPDPDTAHHLGADSGARLHFRGKLG